MNTTDELRKLDAEIAEKVMGLKVEKVVSHEYVYLGETHVGGGHQAYPVPEYSTNKKAAAEVFYKVIGMGGDAARRFADSVGFKAEIGYPGKDSPVWSEQLDPYLVCKAALKAVEWK